MHPQFSFFRRALSPSVFRAVTSPLLSNRGEFTLNIRAILGSDDSLRDPGQGTRHIGLLFLWGQRLLVLQDMDTNTQLITLRIPDHINIPIYRKTVQTHYKPVNDPKDLLLRDVLFLQPFLAQSTDAFTPPPVGASIGGASPDVTRNPPTILPLALFIIFLLGVLYVLMMKCIFLRKTTLFFPPRLRLVQPQQRQRQRQQRQGQRQQQEPQQVQQQEQRRGQRQGRQAPTPSPRQMEVIAPDLLRSFGKDVLSEEDRKNLKQVSNAMQSHFQEIQSRIVEFLQNQPDRHLQILADLSRKVRASKTASFGAGSQSAFNVHGNMNPMTTDILDRFLCFMYPPFAGLSRQQKTVFFTILEQMLREELRTGKTLTLGRVDALLKQRNLSRLYQHIVQVAGGGCSSRQVPRIHQIGRIKPDRGGGGGQGLRRRRTNTGAPYLGLVGGGSAQVQSPAFGRVQSPAFILNCATWNIENPRILSTIPSRIPSIQKKGLHLRQYNNHLPTCDFIAFQEFPSDEDDYRRIYQDLFHDETRVDFRSIIQGDAKNKSQGDLSKQNRLVITYKPSRFQILRMTEHLVQKGTSRQINITVPDLSTHHVGFLDASGAVDRSPAIIAMSHAMGIAVQDKRSGQIFFMINVHFSRDAHAFHEINMIIQNLKAILSTIYQKGDPDNIIIMGDFNQTQTDVLTAYKTEFLGTQPHVVQLGILQVQHPQTPRTPAQRQFRQRSNTSGSQTSLFEKVKNIDGIIIVNDGISISRIHIYEDPTYVTKRVSDHPLKTYTLSYHRK